MTDNCWPADSVERWSIEKLIPSARNARTHSESQVEQIAASMREWGWTTPVLVDEHGELIAGHGRVLAARSLGYKSIPTMIARGWTDEKKRAYKLADNKIAINAGWDAEILNGELNDLAGLDFDLSVIGFSDVDINLIADDIDQIALGGTDDRGQAAVNPEQSSAKPEVFQNTAETYVSFTCMVTVSERDILLDAIARAKARGATDSGSALILISREWMKEAV